MLADIFLKAFLLILKKKIAKFLTTNGIGSLKTLMLVVYPLPDKGHRYPVERGSGLVIVCTAFGDAPFSIIGTCPTLFLFLGE